MARTRDFYQTAAASHRLHMEEVGTLRSLDDTAGLGANEMVLRFTPVLEPVLD